MRSSRLIPLVVAPLLGCSDHEPALGKRVAVTTEVVERVCRGTLDHLDVEIERVESELALAALAERIDLHIVEDIGEHCGTRRACVVQPPRRLYVAPDAYDRLIRYELVRDRIGRTAVSRTKPLFFEGLAGASAWPSCAPTEITLTGEPWPFPSATTVLAATSRGALDSEGRYLGGELMRWLLDVHGPEKVLTFMRAVGRYDNTGLVRVTYTEHFTSILDTDLFAHFRPDDAPISPGRSGCIAPELPRESTTARLAGTLDCDAPGVRNDFNDPGLVFMEWTLTVNPGEDGQYRLLGPLPKGVEVTLEQCACISEAWSRYVYEPPNITWPIGAWRWPTVGIWRLRVSGPIGSSFDFALETPCSLVAQDCPSGQQCSRFRECTDEIPNPGTLGSACAVPVDDAAPRTCAGGLECVGPRGGEGVCMQLCDSSSSPGHRADWGGCAEGLVCGGWQRVCTNACDPLAQDCGPGRGCVPDSKQGGTCLPIGAAGLFESCRMFETDCGPGLHCTVDHDLDGCVGYIENVGPTGCCSPLCDATAADPGCPVELPVCDGFYDDEPVGVCRGEP